MKKFSKKQKKILKWILIALGIIAFILIVRNQTDILSLVGGSSPSSSSGFGGGGLG